MASQATLELLVELKDQASSGLSSLGGALKTVGGIAGGVALAGVAAFGAAVVSGIGDAREAAQIMAQTENVIKSTGGAAGVSAQQVADYAASLSAASGASLFGDSQIQESTNLLLTFTNIKDKTLEAATAISVDMAQALGGAPKDAAIQLGKALNDPIAGISALSRVGVSFTEEQKEQIKTMQEAGDTAGAQAVILAELNKEFGGSAQAAADADGGWAQFNDRLGEAKETLGAAVLPALTGLVGILNDSVMPAIEQGAQAFGDLVGYFTAVVDDGDTLNDFLANLPASIQPVVQLIGELVAAVQSGDFGPFIESLQSLGAQIGPVFSDLVAQATQWVLDALPGLGANLGELYNTLVNWVVDSLPGWIEQLQQLASAAIQWITDSLPGLGTNLGKFAGQLLAWIVQTVIDVTPKLASLGLQFITWVATEVLPKLPGALLAIATGLYNFIKEVVIAVAPKLGELASKFISWIQTDVLPKLPGALAGIRDAINTWIGNTLSWVAGEAKRIGSSIIDGIISGVSGAANALYTKLSSIAAGALQAAKDAIGFGSPARKAMPIGISVVQGIMVGMQQTASALATTMATMTGDVVESAAGAVDQVLGAFLGSDIASAMKGLGKNMMAGIGKGIKDGVKGVIRIVESTASTVTEAFNNAFGSNSPAKELIPVGTFIMQGIMVGIEGMLPDVMGVIDTVGVAMIDSLKKRTEEEIDKINAMIADLKDQAVEVGKEINNAIAGGFESEASINRLLAKNLDAVAAFTGKLGVTVRQQLDDALRVASGFADPAMAADSYKMRSDQIIELAELQEKLNNDLSSKDRARLDAQRVELQKQLDDATGDQADAIRTQIESLGALLKGDLTDMQRQTLEQQLALIGAAQQAEQNAFRAEGANRQNPIQAIIAQLQALMPSLPGILDSPVVAQLKAMFDQLTSGAGGAFTTPGYNLTNAVPASNRPEAPIVYNNTFNLPPGTPRQLADEVIRTLSQQTSTRRA